MKIGRTLIAGLIVAGIATTAAVGDSHVDKATLAAIKARKAQMTLYNFNAGLLFGMAKGDIEYNAEAASAAAANLAAQAAMNQSRLWPAGSDTEALGIEVTRAKAAAWQSDSKAGEYGKALGMATVTMASAAGEGLEALRGAIGPIGKACTACHEDYRVPFN